MVTTKTITAYTFDSLSESAKENVRQQYATYPYTWSDDADAAREAFRGLFSRHCYEVAYTIDPYYYDVNVTVTDDEATLCGIRLWKWIHNNLNCAVLSQYDHCPLTGCFIDHDLLEPLALFYLNPASRPDWRSVTLKRILTECFDSWARAIQTDMRYQNSDEYIIEDCEANEILFDEHGRII